MQAEVRKLELSAEVLQALPAQERYVFALVGHIFNELMLLQKWIHVSRRPPGNPGPQEDAAVAMSMFLLRLLSAKVYEALHDDALAKPFVAEVLRAKYFGQVDGLQAEWDATLAKHEAIEWLGWVRNKGGFHYMSANQWAPGLGDSMCTGAYAYTGKRHGDTYFHWAEMTASFPAMCHVNANEPFEGLRQMIDELGELLRAVTGCLARGLEAFIHTSGVLANVSDPIRFEAPILEPPALHYFFADERLGTE